MPLFKNKYKTESNRLDRLENWDYSSEGIYFITLGAPLQNQNQTINKPSRKRNSISSFIAILKSVTSKQIISLNDIDCVDALRCVSTHAFTEKPFVSRTPIWQSNYHDYIVRNYKSLEKIDSYITNNPENWNSDSINILNANTSI
jgi:hypothetical protein